MRPNPVHQLQRHPEPAALFWLINKTQTGPGRSHPWTSRWLLALLVAHGGQHVGKTNRSVEPGTEFKPCIQNARSPFPISHSPATPRASLVASPEQMQHNVMRKPKPNPLGTISPQMRLLSNPITNSAVYSHNYCISHLTTKCISLLEQFIAGFVFLI